MSSVADTAPAGGAQLSHRQILEVLSGLMLGMFLAALDQTTVASAIRTIGDDLPPREGARYQGCFLAVVGTSSVLGPVIGGFFAGSAPILHVTGWRWVFLVNVPIGIVALAVVARVLNIPHTRREHRIDVFG